MKKKITLLLSFLLACILIFGTAGCNMYDPTQDNEVDLSDVDFNITSDYKDSLNVWVTSDNSEMEMINSFVKSFNNIYPNIEVKVTGIEGSTWVTSLRNAANVPSLAPDIFWASPDKLATFRNFDIILPLTPFVEADPNFSLDGIVEGSLKCCEMDEQLWIMPRDWNQVVMYYNMDMFDAAGVAYPSTTEAMSLSEFETMLDDLKAGLLASEETNSDGRKYKDCFSHTWSCSIMWDSMIWPILKSYGGNITLEDGTGLDANGHPVFDSEESVDAIDWVRQLVAEGHLIELSDHRDNVEFCAETAPVYCHMRNMLTTLIEPRSDYNAIARLGVAPMPNLGKQDNYYVGSGSTGYAMNKATTKKTAAWAFLKSVVSELSQEEVTKTGVVVPVLDSIINDENANWRTFSHKAINHSNFSWEPFVYKRDEIYTHITDFTQYIDVSAQTNVFDNLMTAFNLGSTPTYTKDRAGVAEVVKTWAQNMCTNMSGNI